MLGTACGLGVEGSGWVAGDGLVVTNAHVVAGEDDTVVQVRGSRAAAATRSAVAFDPRNDVAVLRVAGSAAPRAAARRRRAGRAQRGAILGFPDNGPFDVRAGADRRDARPCSPRTPTAAGRCARRITTLRGARAARQLGRPDGRRAAGAW